MTAAHITEFRAAVDAQQQRASLYSNGYATEERNYWTQALGEGEKRLTLKDWMRSAARDSLAAQREAWEAQLAEEARSLPEAVEIGRQALDDAKAISDPLERAFELSWLLECVEALAKTAALVRADALRDLRSSGMSLAQVAEMTGMSRQRVHQITS